MKRSHEVVESISTATSAIKRRGEGGRVSNSSSAWQDALWKYCVNPESFPSSTVVMYDDRSVTIHDCYPKARVHLLVLPRDCIDGFQHLNSSHVELLKHMREQGRQALAKLYADPPNVQVGFHAVPSMRQLHLHIISTDFDSPCMKTKLHYNSFVTSFFIPVEEFIEKLDRPGGAIHIDREEYESSDQRPPH
ncbi:hypothetical protein BASA62_009619 [Batrachochytrium salamandrivorans]|nr:hypothetical protein BASA62_009619 [Batrachochytrium salamandrivorans]